MTELTHARLKELLRYEPETGELYWQVRRSRIKCGALAGCFIPAQGRALAHYTIGILGKAYPRAKLIYFYETGILPPDEVDHIDGNPLNDRFYNLRPATRSQNNANKRCYKNNKFGLKGVHEAAPGRFRAIIRFNKMRINLGNFNTPKQAHRAYCKAAKRLHGEFARTG